MHVDTGSFLIVTLFHVINLNINYQIFADFAHATSFHFAFSTACIVLLLNYLCSYLFIYLSLDDTHSEAERNAHYDRINQVKTTLTTLNYN
jgi:hypothetical protein